MFHTQQKVAEFCNTHFSKLCFAVLIFTSGQHEVLIFSISFIYDMYMCHIIIKVWLSIAFSWSSLLNIFFLNKFILKITLKSDIYVKAKRGK